MKVSELRTVCDALARFATVRDKADDVTTRIGVQAAKGILKLIAGDGVSGVVLSLGETSGEASYYVPARTLFQGVKALPARSEVQFKITGKAFTIVTADGGELPLPNLGQLTEAGFAKKPKGDGSMTHIPEAVLQQIAKLFPAVTRGEEKLSQIVGTIHDEEDFLAVTFVEPRVKTKYASWKQPQKFGAGRAYAVDSGFFEALKAIDGNGVLTINEGITVADDVKSIYSSTLELGTWPILGVTGDLHSFEIDRKKFVAILKGQVPNDEHARVVLTWDKNSLEVRPYGAEGGQSIPVKTVGHGTRGVNATLLLDMLNGMDDAKVVSVGIAEGAPAIILRAEEYKDWTIMLAPLVLH